MLLLTATGLLLAWTAAGLGAVEIGAGWEFLRDGDPEGWEIGQDLSDLTARDGYLTGNVGGDAARVLGPEIEIQAAEYGFIHIRIRAWHSGSVLLRWESDSSPVSFYDFEIVGNGRFRDYEIPVHTVQGWTGTITRLTHLTFISSRKGTPIDIDYIRVLRLGARLEVEKFRAKRIVPKPHERIPLELVVRNTGDAEDTGHVLLELPDEMELQAGAVEQEVPALGVTAVDTVRWVVSAPHSGEFSILVETDGHDKGKGSLLLRVVERRWEQPEFLLGAWSPPTVWARRGPGSLAYYREANFGTVLWVTPADTAADSVAKYGMKCLVDVRSIVPSSTYLRAEDNRVPPRLGPEHFAALDKIIDKFLGHPAVIGYYVVDEPNHHAFENLAAIVAHIRRRDPTRFSYINQHPSSAGPAWFGPRTYRELLEHHLDVIRLELLSYDRYTFFRYGDGPDFFNDLGIVRQVALDYGVPFTNIVQAVGDEADLGLNWRIPNPAEHRWLAYNSLAYGAKSLMWFHWYHSWGVTSSESRDELVASIASVNAEVNALGPYLMPLRSLGAYHVGSVPLGAVALPDTTVVRDVSAAADMVVGLFADELGNEYFMIVNDNAGPVTATIALDRDAGELLTLDVASNRVVPEPYLERDGDALFEADFRPGAGRLYFFSEPTTSVETEYHSVRPATHALVQNYPNPFNPVTTITYDLAYDAAVKLTVYDAAGRVVEVLVDGRQRAGRHRRRWSAEALASGVYFCELRAGGHRWTRKMALLR